MAADPPSTDLNEADTVELFNIASAPEEGVNLSSASTQQPPADGGLFTVANLAIGIGLVALVALVSVLLSRHFSKPRSGRKPSSAATRPERSGGHEPSLGDIMQNINRLQARQDKLEQDVLRLSEARRAAGTDTPRQPLQFAKTAYSIDEGTSPPPPPPPPPAPAAQAKPHLQDVIASLSNRYAELLTSGIRSRERFADFFRSMDDPRAFAISGDGSSLQTGEESEALLEGGMVQGSYVVFPSFDFVSDFATLYNAERSMPPELRAAFDFIVNDSRTLVVERPATLAQLGGNRFAVQERGTITGLMS
jgi:hypothetical protein